MKSAFLLILLLLSGCGSLTRSEYQRPLLSLPQQWPAARSTDRTPPAANWWETFGDPRLSRLIAAVLASNNDLAAAGIRLQQARVAAGLAAGNLTPDVSADSGASNRQALRGAASRESYRSALNLSYELDLWGKLARTREARDWQAVASAADYQATLLSTIGTTAQLYWNIAQYNQQYRNLQQRQMIAAQTTRQVAVRLRAGQVGRLDLLQAQQAELALDNQISVLIQQRASARNALALLLNRPAEQHAAEAPAIDRLPPLPLRQQTPLAVLASRPDIQAAESRLRAALAGWDATRLSFYPTLSLNASLDAGSTLFRQWFREPERSVGALLTLPFVQWHHGQLTIRQASLEMRQAAVSFRRTAYAALAEVDNALARRQSACAQAQRLQQSLRLSAERLDLTRQRYLAGAVDFTTLLAAQDNRLDLDNALAQAQNDVLTATLQLWLAQGGGDMHYRILYAH
ncbi:TolC family protein [Pantoea sp. 1.19]|uniref:TolC family protein n=1 Tax=Pantoea sp. 1.19 TaxID=1925589 RepID=UPI000948F676|nr:TolC family protein [Pantoea sp. 1.19]